MDLGLISSYFQEQSIREVFQVRADLEINPKMNWIKKKNKKNPKGSGSQTWLQT